MPPETPLTAASAAAYLAWCWCGRQLSKSPSGVDDPPVIHNLRSFLAAPPRSTVVQPFSSLPTAVAARGLLASLLLSLHLVSVGASAVACFECINVGVGDLILTAFDPLGGGRRGDWLPARPAPPLQGAQYSW